MMDTTPRSATLQQRGYIRGHWVKAHPDFVLPLIFERVGRHDVDALSKQQASEIIGLCLKEYPQEQPKRRNGKSGPQPPPKARPLPEPTPEPEPPKAEDTPPKPKRTGKRFRALLPGGKRQRAMYRTLQDHGWHERDAMLALRQEDPSYRYSVGQYPLVFQENKDGYRAAKPLGDGPNRYTGKVHDGQETQWGAAERLMRDLIRRADRGEFGEPRIVELEDKDAPPPAPKAEGDILAHDKHGKPLREGDKVRHDDWLIVTGVIRPNEFGNAHPRAVVIGEGIFGAGSWQGTSGFALFKDDERLVELIVDEAEEFAPKAEPKAEEKPKAPPKFGEFQTALDEWKTFLADARRLMARKNADGRVMDEWGYRQAKLGTMLITRKIPVAYCKDTATMHWREENRTALEVVAFRPETFEPERRKDGEVPFMPLARAIVEAGVPLCFYGGAGLGKTHAAEQMAKGYFGDEWEERFAAVSMVEGQPPSVFNGRILLDGSFVNSSFLRIYSQGGVFLFDELDAATPNLVLIVNTAIANGWYFNPVSGKKYVMHKKFIPIAAMNTMGLGATGRFTGRKRLDAATLDRWAMGRIRFAHDTRLEHKIMDDIVLDAKARAEEMGA